MVAGTKRGVLLFALHAVAVQLLTALFTAFFVEYYFHECLVVVKSVPATAQTKVWLSRWGLSFFVLSQVLYAVLSALHRCGLLSLSSRLPPSISGGRLLARPKWFSNEHAFVVAFGLSWCVLRLPLLPSAFCFTLALAAVSALAVKCTALTERAAREMALQRPREGEWVGWAGLQATVAAAPFVFAAARLYDGTAPRSGQLGSFHGLLVGICVSVFVLFSVLQYLRGRMHAEEGSALSRRDEAEPLPVQRLVSNTGSGAATAEGAEFRAFVRQTCQRRSMKALLAVRAMHAYAYAILLFGTHLLLTLGGGLALSSSARAAVLAVVFAASSLLRPFCAALCTALGKKHAVSMTIAAVAATGNLALYAAYFTRGTPSAAEVKKGKATAATPLSTATEAAVDAFGAGTVWCVVLVVVQRLLLEVVGELLDLAQEDVVEEDSILFGRAASMATWTSRLTSVATVPMQSLSLIISFLFLTVTSALRVVQQPQSAAAAAALRPSFLLSTSTPTTTTMMTSTTRLSSSASALPQLWVVASGSSVLALLGLQTCGVGVAMWVVWHRVYNLEGKHLQFVEMAIRKRKDEQALSLV